jgi:tetratricopeptide (TPR) repeat protein
LAAAAAAYDYDWKEAEAHARMALAAGYVPPEVRMWGGQALVACGRFSEVVQELEKAVEQDPLNAAFRAGLSGALYLAGLYDRALAEAQKALELDEHYWPAHYLIGITYAVQGMFSEALGPTERAYRLAPWNPRVLGLLAGILVRMGEKERAAELLDKLKGMAALGMVTYHMLSSQIDAAADWLEKAIEQREIHVSNYAHAASAKPLRESPRWPKLAKMMNLPAGTP